MFTYAKASLVWLCISLTLSACQPVPPTPQSAGSTAILSPLPTPIETSTRPPNPTQAEPTRTQQVLKRPSSVFVVCFDAGRADLVYQWMDAGLMPHFATLAQRGIRAEYASSVNPPLTASAQNSIATGALPTHTGIVSNMYHNPNDNFYWYRRGTEELSDVEPAWVTASKAGLTTAAVFFVGGSPARPGQTADYTIGYGVRDAYSDRKQAPLSAAQGWANAPASYSPLLEASYLIPKVAWIYLLAVDTSDDQTKNYDTVFVNTSRRITNDTPRLKVGDWGSLTLLPTSAAGADFLIQGLTANDVTFYYSDIYHNTAMPRQLLEDLNQKFGFFRSGGDSYALRKGWITADDYLHQEEDASLWMAEVAAWVFSAYHPNLLFTWQDALDAAGHTFFMQDERQANYSPELAAQYAADYRRATQIADQALETMLQAISLDNTALMLVADHGMLPVHTTFYVNTLMQQAGLLKLDKRAYVEVNKSKVFSVASGGAANFYVNLKGRERNGFVTPEEYPQVQQAVIEALKSVSDPQTGTPVFQRILARQELPALGLDHPNAGDVFAQAMPGFELDSWRGVKELFRPSTVYGQHGYDRDLPEMRTFFIAAGAGVPADGEVIPPIALIDYAPTIANLLGYKPVSVTDGSPIPALVHP